MIFIIILSLVTCQTLGILSNENSRIPNQKIFIECPVCEKYDSLFSNIEECPFELKTNNELNVKFKECKYGMYQNYICGNKWDCYRGPAENCTESLLTDTDGQKCMPSYRCDAQTRTCVGLGNKITIRPSELRHQLSIRDEFNNRFDPLYMFKRLAQFMQSNHIKDN